MSYRDACLADPMELNEQSEQSEYLMQSVQEDQMTKPGIAYDTLIKSSSRQAISKNIATERKAGKPERQSIAIAYSVAREARKGK